MRVHYVALLAVALLASSGAASAITDSNMVTPELPAAARSIAGEQGDVRPTRMLRRHKVEDADDAEEERGIGIKYVDELLETHQLKGWLKNSVSTRDAIGMTKLDDAGESIFTSPQWTKWANYVSMTDKTNADREMASALLGHYGADQLTSMLAAAAKVPETRAIATKLEGGLVSFWKSMDSSPELVFTALKLENKADDLFDSPAIPTWISYLKAYNEKHADKPVSIAAVFGKYYGGETTFFKKLAQADDANSAGAKTLQDEVLTGWLNEPTHPMNVFKKFELDQAGDDLLSNPLLVPYVQYMKAFNKDYPNSKTTLIQTLTKNYPENVSSMLEAAKKVPSTKMLATNLQTAQFKQWIVQGKTPDDIFKNVLKLKSTSSPDADVWRAYYKMYEAEHPGKLFSFTP